MQHELLWDNAMMESFFATPKKNRGTRRTGSVILLQRSAARISTTSRFVMANPDHVFLDSIPLCSTWRCEPRCDDLFLGGAAHEEFRLCFSSMVCARMA